MMFGIIRAGIFFYTFQNSHAAGKVITLKTITGKQITKYFGGNWIIFCKNYYYFFIRQRARLTIIFIQSNIFNYHIFNGFNPIRAFVKTFDQLQMTATIFYKQTRIIMTNFDNSFKTISDESGAEHKKFFSPLLCMFDYNFIGKRFKPFLSKRGWKQTVYFSLGIFNFSTNNLVVA